MSYISTDTSAVSGLGSGDVPQDISTGNSTAKQAYSEGLAFEQILVDQLVQTMTSNISGSSANTSMSSASATEPDSGSVNQSGLLAGGDPSTSAYSSLMTGALTDSIMSGGGVGIASEIAQDIDPEIGTPAGEAGGTPTSSAATGGVAA
jgi:hypothetical protein